MSHSKVNTLYVLDSIPEGESQTGYHLYHDIIKKYADFYNHSTPFVHQYLKLKSKSDFLNALTHIENCLEFVNNGVLIHIESHGSENGISFQDGSRITWQELKSKLISINVKLENRLYISMATCHGNSLYKTISLKNKVPFCAFIASSKEVNPDQVLEFFEPFFINLIKNRDIKSSFTMLEEMAPFFYFKDVQFIYIDQFEKHLQNLTSDTELRNSFIEDCKEDFRNPNFQIEGQEYQHYPNVDPDSFDFELILARLKKDLTNMFEQNFLFGQWKRRL
ncbi:hypothetical protein SAMN06298216_4379 [Spirosomataceae bacterium TFI 002]|nr:hypothetical protein SAMN06298216_4379 [Spirosomataceae bacterium TFI 002]